MAGSAVSNIFSPHSTATLLTLLANSQVEAECFGTPLSGSAWHMVCELETRLPELRLFLDEVTDDGSLTVEHLNGILMAAEEALDARASNLATA
ncbi:MAG TPA: hypothetical protein VF885_14850 [Arthrobacter sp.]